MKRQRYLSKRKNDQVMWLTTFAQNIEAVAAKLGLDATSVKADALWMAFVLGPWREALRTFSKGATSYITNIEEGGGNSELHDLPVAALPTPPPGVVSVPFGAMRRITKFVQKVKNAPEYDESMGRRLQIIGSENVSLHPAPELILEAADGRERAGVNVYFKKLGHYGLLLESRVLPDGEWGFVNICTDSPYLDERPLRVPGQPEMREYRARFWDRGEANGDWSDIPRIVVGT